MDYGGGVVGAKEVTYDFSKRMFDIFVSGILIILFSPVLLAVAIAVKITSPGPVLYRGERAAKGGGVYKLLKFRGMKIDIDHLGGHSTAVDDPRFTPIARFLRRYKLDELPQLFNVLIGDMSLVGPRPQVTYYTNKYNEAEKVILSVRPGITDLASLYFIDMDKTLGSGDVDQKYETEIEPLKNKLRLRYVRERSFLLDLRILIETFFRIFGINGIAGLDIKP